VGGQCGQHARLFRCHVGARVRRGGLRRGGQVAKEGRAFGPAPPGDRPHVGEEAPHPLQGGRLIARVRGGRPAGAVVGGSGGGGGDATQRGGMVVVVVAAAVAAAVAVRRPLRGRAAATTPTAAAAAARQVQTFRDGQQDLILGRGVVGEDGPEEAERVCQGGQGGRGRRTARPCGSRRGGAEPAAQCHPARIGGKGHQAGAQGGVEVGDVQERGGGGRGRRGAGRPGRPAAGGGGGCAQGQAARADAAGGDGRRKGEGSPAGGGRAGGRAACRRRRRRRRRRRPPLLPAAAAALQPGDQEGRQPRLPATHGRQAGPQGCPGGGGHGRRQPGQDGAGRGQGERPQKRAHQRGLLIRGEGGQDEGQELGLLLGEVGAQGGGDLGGLGGEAPVGVWRREGVHRGMRHVLLLLLRERGERLRGYPLRAWRVRARRGARFSHHPTIPPTLLSLFLPDRLPCLVRVSACVSGLGFGGQGDQLIQQAFLCGGCGGCT